MAPPPTQHGQPPIQGGGLPPALPVRPAAPLSHPATFLSLGDSGHGESPQRQDEETLLKKIHTLQVQLDAANQLARRNNSLEALNARLCASLNTLTIKSADLQEQFQKLSDQAQRAEQALNTDEALALRVAYFLSLTGEPVLDGRKPDHGERLRKMAQCLAQVNTLLAQPAITTPHIRDVSHQSFCNQLLHRFDLLFAFYHPTPSNKVIIQELSVAKEAVIAVASKGGVRDKKSIFEMSSQDRAELMRLIFIITKWEREVSKAIVANEKVLHSGVKGLQARVGDLEEEAVRLKAKAAQYEGALQVHIQHSAEREQNVQAAELAHHAQVAALLDKIAAQEADLHARQQELVASARVTAEQNANIAELNAKISRMQEDAVTNMQKLQAAKLKFKDAITEAVASYKGKRGFLARAESMQRAFEAVKEIDAAETVGKIVEVFQRLYSELAKPVGVTGAKSALHQFLQGARNVLIREFPAIVEKETDRHDSHLRSVMSA